jgi:hypothetical protein
MGEVMLMEITINATIPDNVAAAIQNGSTRPIEQMRLSCLSANINQNHHPIVRDFLIEVPELNQ